MIQRHYKLSGGVITFSENIELINKVLKIKREAMKNLGFRAANIQGK